MYGRKKSLFWGEVLSSCSMLYGMVVRIRRALYRFHLIRSEKLPCTVISVGNLTLGGTGKTPAVIYLAALLLKRQKRPVVVSRGYGRKDGSAIVVVADGRSILVDAQTGGDEPVLIASKLPGTPVVVGRKRYPAALAALQRFNADTVVLDDGFQHIQLTRTLDIVLVDANEPFGNGKLFPAGILREPITALKRAHAVLITRAESGNELEPLKKIIRQHTQARIFTSHQTPLDLMDSRTGEAKPLSALRGSKVLAFSGIARPASFTSLLRSLGAVIAEEVTYPDHYDYNKSDLADIFQKAADEKANMIITTEKDAIRLKKLRPDGIWALRIELTVVEREAWEAFLLRDI
jgi:tetraacyldisaccharide 4'-kinase